MQDMHLKRFHAVQVLRADILKETHAGTTIRAKMDEEKVPFLVGVEVYPMTGPSGISSWKGVEAFLDYRIIA